MGLSKLWQLASAWILSLGLSALLVEAGRRWPQPLPIRPAWVWALLLLVPLATLVALLVRWAVVEGGESSSAMKERR
jgi:hypothetical protein